MVYCFEVLLFAVRNANLGTQTYLAILKLERLIVARWDESKQSQNKIDEKKSE